MRMRMSMSECVWGGWVWVVVVGALCIEQRVGCDGGCELNLMQSMRCHKHAPHERAALAVLS